MEKIIVSKCLLGYPCRYDGKSVPCKEVMDLQDRYELIPVCPEELGGLPTPRIPAEIVGDKVLRADGADVTGEYILGAKLAYTYAAENGCTLAILKSKSPSCGKGMVYDGTFTKTLTKGDGITVQLFERKGINIIDEKEAGNLK
ncbi:MAG: DUF523 domain-containing protein [Clostridia bacterium]|nr:DUF523 domain-containing protein [Clostridia bacterium]